MDPIISLYRFLTGAENFALKQTLHQHQLTWTPRPLDHLAYSKSSRMLGAIFVFIFCLNKSLTPCYCPEDTQ